MIANIDAKIQKYLEELERSDQEQAEPAPTVLERKDLEKKIAALQERKEDYQDLEAQLGEDHQLSTTDPDSRLMHTRQRAEMAYNVQTAVDGG